MAALSARSNSAQAASMVERGEHTATLPCVVNCILTQNALRNKQTNKINRSSISHFAKLNSVQLMLSSVQ